MAASIVLREEKIAQQIYFLRGERVMLDYDLAQLYQVETRALKQAVKRNMDSFPSDFKFVLNAKEIKYLVSQNVIPSKQVPARRSIQFFPIQITDNYNL